MGNICDKSKKRIEKLHPINPSSQIKNVDILTGKQREKLQVVFLKDRKTDRIRPLITLRSNLPQSKIGRLIWQYRQSSSQKKVFLPISIY